MADDRTQFLIDLAAKFSGGETAVATLATLGDKMLVAGAGAEEFERITNATSGALEDAAAAAMSAAEALSVGQARYTEFETGADRAAKMVEKLSADLSEQGIALQRALEVGEAKQIERAEKKIWELAQRQQDAVVKSNAAAAALKSEAAAMDALGSKAAAATAKHGALQKGLANVKSAANETSKAAAASAGSGKMNEMAEALGRLGGPAGIAGQKVLALGGGFQKLGKAMGSAGPYIAVAVAIIAIASAAAIAAFAITKWGFSLAEANRSQALLAQGVAQSVAGGDALNAKIDELSKTVPATREELLAMAGDLAKTGLRGKELTDALEAAAVKAAELKFGPDFAKQMLSLDVQSRVLNANLAKTFGGLKIDPLLEGMQTLGALFDSSTASGRALKFLFETLFQPLIDGAAAVMPKIERMFLYAEILALKAYIALKPYRSEIQEVGHALLIGAAIIGGIFAAGIALVVGLFALLFAMSLSIVNAVYQLVDSFIALEKTIFGGLSDAVSYMTNLGGAMIDGLVNGITSKATAVVDAMTGVVKGGVDAVTKFLQLGSPSKLLFGKGENTAEGYAGGVESGTADAQGALEAMVAPPNPGGGRAAGAGGSVVNVAIENINVTGADGQARAEDLIEQFTAWLESVGITVGGGEAPSGA
jgi:hypothetical protein